MSYSITTWQVETVREICTRNEKVCRIYRHIELGPTCDYIYVVILSVLLSIYCFLHKCSIFGAHNFRKKKKSHFCAETFCLIYQQNTSFFKLNNCYLDISHVPSLTLHFILIQF